MPQGEARTTEQKFITFSLGDEDYGIPVLEVLEIVRIENLIRVPHARDYLMGMMDIRGHVIPILDLRKKLQMENLDGARERAILIAVGTRRVGLAVDRVAHVRSFTSDSIDEGPPVLRSASNRHVIGVGKSGDQFIVLMSLENLFAADEVEQFFDR